MTCCSPRSSKRKGSRSADVVMNRVGDEHSAGIGQGFDPRSDIYAVAVEIVALDDHVAEIDADAEFDTPFSGNVSVALCHVALHLDRTANRIDNTSELDQCAMAGGFDEAAAVFPSLWVDQFALQCL